MNVMAEMDIKPSRGVEMHLPLKRTNGREYEFAITYDYKMKA